MGCNCGKKQPLRPPIPPNPAPNLNYNPHQPNPNNIKPPTIINNPHMQNPKGRQTKYGYYRPY